MKQKLKKYGIQLNKKIPIDEFLEKAIGIGPTFIGSFNQGSYALQTQYRYLRELLLGERFFVSIFVADFTPKRLHLMSQLISLPRQQISATCETIMVNVDLNKNK